MRRFVAEHVVFVAMLVGLLLAFETGGDPAGRGYLGGVCAIVLGQLVRERVKA